MDSALAQVLAALSRAFGREQVPWYLFGARAAVLYGSRRLTADVDVTVILGDVDVTRLVSSMRAEGLWLRVDDDEFVARTRVLPLSHHSTSMPVDVVLGTAGLEEMFLAHARVIDVLGVAVPVIAPGDLVVTKLIAGRPLDIEDAAAVVRARSDVDMDEVRTTISAIVEALGENDAAESLAKLERALARG